MVNFDTPIEGILNFSWVIPGRLCACAMPGTLGNLSEDLRTLNRWGVTHLVSLTSLDRSFGNSCREAGIEWVHFPIRDFGVPADPQAFDALMEASIEWLEQGAVICAHCQAGIGRTGIYLSCLMGLFFGINGLKAVETLRKTRTALDTEIQRSFVLNYLK